jgi:hypothetical protein
MLVAARLDAIPRSHGATWTVRPVGTVSTKGTRPVRGVTGDRSRGPASGQPSRFLKPTWEAVYPNRS